MRIPPGRRLSFSVMSYLSVLLTMFILQLVAFARGAQDEVFNAIFSQQYSVSYLNITNGYTSFLPSGMCAGRNWTYTEYFKTGSDTNTFRVPHSRIYVDGMPCGDLSANATKAQLWLENFMLLAPAYLLTSQSSADSVFAGALYRDLQDPNDRHGLARVLFYQLIQTGNPVWVGYEGMADRVCGGKLIFPRTAFVLFSRVLPNATAGLDISQAYRNVSSPVYIQKGEQFHLVVDEPFDRTLTNPNRVCPAVQTHLVVEKPSSTPVAENSSTSCFPFSALVALADGSTVPMSEVSTGSNIKDVNGLTSEVFMFTHRDISKSLHKFVFFMTAENLTLTVSPGHYVYTPDGLRPAQNLHVGSFLILGDGRPSRIVERFIVLREGLYNPQTMSGSLVVDGFAVSAYTTAVSPPIAHAMLYPVRLLYRCSVTKSFVQRTLSHLLDGGMSGPSRLIEHLGGTDLTA